MSVPGFSLPPSSTKGRTVRVEHSATKRSADIEKFALVGNSTIAKAKAEIEKNYEYFLPPKHDGQEKQQLERRFSSHSTKLTVEEILYIISEKVRKERHFVNCLFERADSFGQGFVTRSALLKIMYSLCPLLRVEHFHRILAMTGMDELTMITFNDFESYIVDYKPNNRAYTTSLVGSGSGRFVSMAFAHQLLRQYLVDDGIDPHTVFPPSCFREKGVLVQPQLREALQRLDIHMTDEDFKKLWIRFDKDGVDSIPFEQFMKHLKSGKRRVSLPGIKSSSARSESGEKTNRPSLERCKTSPNKFATSSSKTPLKVSSPLKDVSSNTHSQSPVTFADQTQPEKEDQGKANMLTASLKFGKPGNRYRRRLTLLKDKRPRLPDLLQSLQYIFEEAYHGFLVTLHRHGVGGSYGLESENQINLPEFTRVLSEFGCCGFTVEDESILDRDVDFMQKSNNNCRVVALLADQYGCRARAGKAINFEVFFNKLYSRSLSSPLQRHKEELMNSVDVDDNIDWSSVTNSNDLERKILNLLHAEYLKFVKTIESFDPMKTGFITESQLQTAVRAILGYNETPQQWEEFLKRLGNDRSDKGIAYNRQLLSFFNVPVGISERFVTIEPPKANTTTVSLRPATPPQRNDRKDVSLNSLPCRSFPKLLEHVGGLLRNKFHRFDKGYKKSTINEERQTINKEQFGELLISIGSDINKRELEAVWNTLPRSAHEKWNYRQVLRHFILMASPKRDSSYSHLQIDKQSGDARKTCSANVDAHLQRLRDFREQQKTEKAQYIEQLVNLVNQHEARSPGKLMRVITPERRKELLNKIRPQMTAQYDVIRDTLRKVDILGYCYVDYQTAQRLMDHFQLGLTGEEKYELCRGFDREAKGQFRYMEFLRKFAPTREDHEDTKYDLYMTQLRDKLLKDHRSLMAAFRHLDTSKTGRLDINAFNKSLHKCGIYLSQSDLYHLLTEFDSDMNGLIDYEEFLTQLLKISSTK